VQIGVPADDGPGVRAYAEDEFGEALSGADRIELIMSWGYVNRPAFGNLRTREAFFARTWNPAAPVQPVALVAPGQERKNVVPAFLGSGYEVVPVSVLPDDEKERGGRDPWEAPNSAEDHKLNGLWEQREREGWWFAEVPIGSGAPRRLDAVVVDSPEPGRSAEGEDLQELRRLRAAGAGAELVEAKAKSLDVDVIGQLECGKEMFEQDYPGDGPLKLTACVGSDDEEGLHWYCEQAGIDVVVLPDPA
jgi:hypothetical protein